MSLKWLVALLMALTTVVAQAAAQDVYMEEDWELSGLIGRTFISNQGVKGDGEIRFGK